MTAYRKSTAEYRKTLMSTTCVCVCTSASSWSNSCRRLWLLWSIAPHDVHNGGVGRITPGTIKPDVALIIVASYLLSCVPLFPILGRDLCIAYVRLLDDWHKLNGFCGPATDWIETENHLPGLQIMANILARPHHNSLFAFTRCETEEKND